MKILSITLEDYNPFKHFGIIKKLHINFTSNTQVIIGDNGCGKSTFLKELNPYPAFKNDYGKSGFKEIILEHNGKTYTATSDFTNKSHIHSFIVDNKELNENGLATIQEELVEKHLGYTKTIHNLLFQETQMCQLSKSDRKALLLAINPVDMTFILEKHKKICSKIKECKNNLTLLYLRKKEIEDKLLSNTVLKMMYTKKENYEKKLAYLDNIIFMLNNNIEKTKSMLTTINIFSDLTDNDYKKLCYNILHKLPFCSHIDRETNIVELSSDISEKIGSYSSKITSIKDILFSLLKDIQQYEELLKTSINKKDISLIENELIQINSLIKETNFDEKISTFTKEQLNILENILPDILEICMWFVENRTTKIMPSKYILKFENILMKYQQKTIYRKNSIIRLKEEIQNIILDNKKYEEYTPNKDCLQICSLKDFYYRITNKNNELIHKLQKECDIHLTKQKLYEKIITHIETILSIQKIYSTKLTILKNIFDKNTFLYTLYASSLSIIYYLNTNPLKIVDILNQGITNTKNYYLLKTYKEKKIEIEKSLELSKKDIPSITIIENILKEKKTEYENLLKQNIDLEKQIKIFYTKKNYLNIYVESKNQIKKIKEDYEKICLKNTLTKSLEYHEKLLNAILKLKNEIYEELRKNETILKEQEFLQDRYKNEILALITSIEKNKELYELIEKALSPISGIPQKFMIKYINTLINNVNYFISKTWKFELQLLPFNINDPIDFIFKVKTLNGTITDIAKCSKGQKQMINLAFSLTILLHMKILHLCPLFLDETDEGLDVLHTQKYLELLSELVDTRYISQLFIINHNAPFHSGFTNNEVICLSSENIPTPEIYNKHVHINEI